MLEYILYMISMSYTPGPNVILSTANASQKGFPKCLILSMGMVVGITLITTICYFAVSFLISLVAQIEPILKVLGIIYLLWLAFCLFRKGTIGSTDDGGGFWKGFYLQFLNVKLYMLCITATSSYIIPMGQGLFKGFLISMVTPIVCFSGLCLWSLFGVSLRKLYSSHARLLNSIFGLSLVYLAIKNLISLFY